MPDRCGNVRRDRLTFELFQAEEGFEEFASAILAAKRKNSHLYFTFSYSHCAWDTRTQRWCVSPFSWRRHLTTSAATTGSSNDFSDIATASGKKFLLYPLTVPRFALSNAYI